MSQRTPLIIHIRAPRVHSFLMTLDTSFEELDYDKDLHERYLVMDWPSDGQYVIIDEEQLERNFDTASAKETWFFQPVVMDERN